MTNCLVFDLGAGSGRAMLAHFDGTTIKLTEIHRFSGIEIRRADGPHWDFRRLLSEIDTGLRLAVAHCGQIDSIGVDSWGVDYALIDGNGDIEDAPFHYRHPRSQAGYDHFPVADDVMFDRTGAQILPVNTAYQLHSAVHDGVGAIRPDHQLLMIADAVCYHLTGERHAERTAARTTGLVNLSGDWDDQTCREAGIPSSLLAPIVAPGTVRGFLRADLGGMPHKKPVPVIAVAGHDTASAVCGLPIGDDEAFLICGSWLILGRELDRPLVSAQVRSGGFGNEGGVEGRAIFLRSLNGLHLLQKLRTSWIRRTGKEVSFADMSAAARAAMEEGSSVEITPSDAIFFDPADMVAVIAKAWHGARSDEVMTLGTLALAVFRGLTRELAASLAVMNELVGQPVHRLSVCGGGGQDETFCQLIADRTGLPVRVGPIEASAWGNAVLQLIGLGLIENLSAGRDLVEKSADILNYYPKDIEAGPE